MYLAPVTHERNTTSAPYAFIIANEIGGNLLSRTTARKRRPIIIIISKVVLSFAAKRGVIITPRFLTTIILVIVTITSLAINDIVIHHGRAFITESASNANPVSILSAMGSQSFPNSESFVLLAMYPSQKSERAPITKRTSATIRNVWFPDIKRENIIGANIILVIVMESARVIVQRVFIPRRSLPQIV